MAAMKISQTKVLDSSEWLSQKFELVDHSTSVQFVFLKLQNNFTTTLKTNVSYGLLLQQFLGTFSDIFIISVKADTRNFSQNYQQFFTRRHFLWTVGSTQARISTKYLPAMKSKHFMLLLINISFSSQRRSHCVKNENIMMKSSSLLKASLLTMEPP